MFFKKKKVPDACNLECLRGEPLREFIGPVKIVLVDQDYGYPVRQWSAATITFANILIGANLVSILYFIFIFQMPLFIIGHILACSFGLGLLMPSGIMMLNHYFGGTAQLQHKDKRAQHVFLHHTNAIFGFGGGLFGMVYLTVFPLTVHTISGVATLFGLFVTAGIGPIVYFSERCEDHVIKKIQKVKIVHGGFGVFTLVMAAVCMCSSFFKPSFLTFSKSLHLVELPFLLTIFCVLYTVAIIKGITWKLNN